MDEQPSSSAADSSNNSGDGEIFEPTAEMLVNDFDDERTLDEEEAMEEADDQKNELSNLEKEKDMPIEDLLAMYGYNEEDDGAQSNHSSSFEETLAENPPIPEKVMVKLELPEQEENEVEQQEEKPSEPGSTEGEAVVPVEELEADEVEEKEPPSMLHELYKDDPSVPSGSRHLRSGSRQQSEEDEEEEEDYDYTPDEDDWKKTIMVGSDYQAVIPEGLCTYGDALPYENEDKLLWDPNNALTEKEIKEFLRQTENLENSMCEDMDAIPRGSHIRDDEKGLYTLLQCGFNIEEAQRRQRLNNITSPEAMSMWSEEECRNFELGLRAFGKDFHSIQQSKVRTRSVSELVQFYYLWKKTERHDVFANKARLEKKKYTLHPGTTEFMERFLDEQESPVSSPSYHSLLSGDPKRQIRTPPPQNSAGESESMTEDEARLLTNHFESISKHLDKDGFESLCKFAAAAKQPNGISSVSVSQTSAGEGFSSSLSKPPCPFMSTSDTLLTQSSAQTISQ